MYGKDVGSLNKTYVAYVIDRITLLQCSYLLIIIHNNCWIQYLFIYLFFLIWCGVTVTSDAATLQSTGAPPSMQRDSIFEFPERERYCRQPVPVPALQRHQPISRSQRANCVCVP